MRKMNIVLILIALIFHSSILSAASVIPQSLDSMSKKAGKIFYGKCDKVEVINDERGLTSTLVTYDVYRSVKGEIGSSVTFKIFGVVTGDVPEGYAPGFMSGVNYEPGQENVLFLYEESQWGFTSPVGLWQGDFPVAQTESGPMLQKKTSSYENAVSKGSLKSLTGRSDIKTPDELLDVVEKIIQ